MDKEIASYIRNYFSNLMTNDERLALKHHMYTNKTSDNSKMREVLAERGVISKELRILEFLRDGYEEFEFNVAKRILAETPEKVFLNYCPNCGKLARTPYARQCRYCGHNWHDLVAGRFKLNSSFQLTGGHFYLLGQITEGEIKQGQFMDLTMLGLNKKPKIEAIEFALKQDGGKVGEDIALRTDELTVDEKEFIKNKGSFGTPFDVIKER